MGQPERPGQQGAVSGPASMGPPAAAPSFWERLRTSFGAGGKQSMTHVPSGGGTQPSTNPGCISSLSAASSTLPQLPFSRASTPVMTARNTVMPLPALHSEPLCSASMQGPSPQLRDPYQTPAAGTRKSPSTSALTVPVSVPQPPGPPALYLPCTSSSREHRSLQHSHSHHQLGLGLFNSTGSSCSTHALNSTQTQLQPSLTSAECAAGLAHGGAAAAACSRNSLMPPLLNHPTYHDRDSGTGGASMSNSSSSRSYFGLPSAAAPGLASGAAADGGVSSLPLSRLRGPSTRLQRPLRLSQPMMVLPPSQEEEDIGPGWCRVCGAMGSWPVRGSPHSVACGCQTMPCQWAPGGPAGIPLPSIAPPPRRAGTHSVLCVPTAGALGSAQPIPGLRHGAHPSRAAVLPRSSPVLGARPAGTEASVLGFEEEQSTEDVWLSTAGCEQEELLEQGQGQGQGMAAVHRGVGYEQGVRHCPQQWSMGEGQAQRWAWIQGRAEGQGTSQRIMLAAALGEPAAVGGPQWPEDARGLSAGSPPTLPGWLPPLLAMKRSATDDPAFQLFSPRSGQERGQ